MTIDYILDTNIFILLFNGQLDEAIPEGFLGFSMITEIELLSFSEMFHLQLALLMRIHMGSCEALPA